MRARIPTLLLIAALGAYASAQTVSFANGKSATVQAKMVGRYFSVDGVVNGKTAHFIVDTGAGLSVLTPEAAEKFGIKGGLPVAAQGAGKERKQALLVKVGSIGVGGATVKDENAVVIDLPPVLRCDGLVGYSFLKHFAVTLDYASAKLTFTDPTGFVPPEQSYKSDMKIVSNIPRIPGAVDGIEGWFQLDSGANGGMSLMAAFVEKNKLDERYGKGEPRIVGKGVGGFTMGRRARVAKVEIAGETFTDVPVVLSTQTEGALAATDLIANVGAELLNRFTVTLDYGGSKAYFVKNASFNRLYSVDRSGLWVDMDGKVFKVVDVVPNGPGADVGVQVGDEVVAVDGKPVAQIEPLELSKYFQAPAGTKVKVSLKRAGEEKEVVLILRDFD